MTAIPVLPQRDAELSRLRTFATVTQARHEEIYARLAKVDLGRDHVDVVALALDVLAILDGPAPTPARRVTAEEQPLGADATAYREVWDATIPPGGYVCAACGEPVESEPCPEHSRPHPATVPTDRAEVTTQ